MNTNAKISREASEINKPVQPNAVFDRRSDQDKKTVGCHQLALQSSKNNVSINQPNFQIH